MYCFLAVLLARGVVAKGLPINELWNKTWGPLIFTKIMTRNRFYEILKLIRFDDKTTRRRLQGDRFALFGILVSVYSHLKMVFQTKRFSYDR